MPVKDFLIKKTAEDLDLPVEVVDRVIMGEYKKFNKATKWCDTMEISGFGTIYVSQPKVKKKIVNRQMWLDKQIAELQEATDVTTINRLTKRIEENEGIIAFYRTKLKPTDGQLQENNGGVEESPLPSEGTKGTDQGSLRGEVEHLPQLPV